MKIIINGAGRIGRNLIRRLSERNYDVLQINDPYLTIENLAYLLNFDSVFGKLQKKFKVNKKYLIYGKKKIKFSNEHNFYNSFNFKQKIVIMNSSGIKKNHDLLKKKTSINFNKAIITHTYEKSDIQIIFGVNDSKFDKQKHRIISTSICDAVAIGPVVSVLNKEFKITSGSILTLHPWLGYQNLTDGPSRSFAYPGEIIENFSLGRASTEALIPKKTSCVSAITSVIPELKNKFVSMSVRVPTPIVSSAIINLNFIKKIDYSKLSSLFRKVIKKQ